MIKKQDMSLAVASGQPLSLDQFNALGGETFAGLNVLKLAVGQADGPFIFVEFKAARILNAKYKTPIRTATAQRCDKLGAPISTAMVELPACASMAGKIYDSDLQAGDVFFIGRGPNYTSAKGRDDCNSYMLKVISRNPKRGAKLVAPETKKSKPKKAA